MSDTKLGIGRATGMFYHAPAGTALPDDISAAPGTGWTEVGDVSADGITLTLDKSNETLRNWANEVKRVIMTEHTESISAPIMDTTPEVFETIFGSANVTTTSGKTSVNLSAGSLPAEEAYLFLMKDGDDLIGIGCTNGQITSIDDVTFAPGEAITWTPTITAIGSGFTLLTQ